MAKKGSRLTEQDRAAKAAAKAKLQAEKLVEQANKKRSAEVNKLRTSKSETLREVQLYLSSDLAEPSCPLSTILPDLSEKFDRHASEIITTADTPLPGLIRFKRFHRANWHESRGLWIPVDEPSEAWVDEGLVAVFVEADELVDKIRLHLDVKAGRGSPSGVTEEETLEGWVRRVEAGLSIGATPALEVPLGQVSPTHPRDEHGRPSLMLVIHGLKAYHTKTRSAAQRELAARAKAGIETNDAGRATARSKASAPPRVSKDDVERELVGLHLRHGWLQVQVDSPAEMTEWLYNMAADLAIRPVSTSAIRHGVTGRPLAHIVPVHRSSARP